MSSATTEQPPSKWPVAAPRLAYRNPAAEKSKAHSTQHPSTSYSTRLTGDSIDSQSSTSLSRTTTESRPTTSPNFLSRTTTESRPTTSPSSNPSNRSRGNAGPRVSANRSSTMSSAATKKRGSLLGGLFIKEPTGAALEQMAQQMKAQHGELSARAVPGVSSAKMPGNVPKVNSKWDGLPQNVKLKETAERDRRSKRSSASTRPRRSRSAEPVSRDGHRESAQRQQRRLSNSTEDSTGNREANSHQFRPNQTHASNSTVSTCDSRSQISSNSSGQNKRTPSTRSQSLRSPSGSTLPEITSFFPDSIPEAPNLPVQSKNDKDVKLTTSTDETPVLRSSRTLSLSTPEPQLSSLPDHLSSPGPTPSDSSPATPESAFSQNDIYINAMPGGRRQTITKALPSKSEEVILLSSGNNVLGPPATARRKIKAAMKGFLAGEAQPLEVPDNVLVGSGKVTSPKPESRGGKSPASTSFRSFARVQQDLEKRPVSSRDRLGLRASMIVVTDDVPWASPGRESENTQSPTDEMPSHTDHLPKGLGLFVTKT